MTRIITSLVFMQIFSAEAFLPKYPKLEIGIHDRGNPGKPLFLTPLIEARNITKGRSLARVNITESLNITSYAGYFTVNKTHNSNQFFWYFPAINESDPVVVWLEGGPGGSSLLSLFYDHGPLRIHNLTLQKANYTWALNHHMIYIDNPVGTGFSFTEDPEGYCKDEVQVGEELYSSMTQFFQLFPELQSNQFYITGESYGGKYVPAFAYTIHKKNPTARVKINLKGMAIGNGLSDPIHQMNYSKYYYELGLLDWNQAKVVEDFESQVIKYIKQEKWRKAVNTDNDMLQFLSSTTGFRTFNNYVQTKKYDVFDVMGLAIFIESSKFRRNIHVGNLTYNGFISEKVYNNLTDDIMKSVAPWISELLDHYRLLVYTGQLDLIVPYPLVENYLRKLNFTGSEEYQTADRHIWMVNRDVAGYVKQAGNLTEILVRNAGHSVGVDQPAWGLDLITTFTHGKKFYKF